MNINSTQIGQKVLHPEYEHRTTEHWRVTHTGEIVELDLAAGRARVAWPKYRWDYDQEIAMLDGVVRTWVKASRLRPAGKVVA